MADEEGLRARKKRATRQAISDVATRLFAERGFDAVTVDEIARAAGVSRMTLFNYFPRKEDLVLDREPEMLEMIRSAAGDRPIAGLRALFTELASAGHPLMGAVEGAPGFWALISSSPVLVARLWSMVDAMEEEIAAIVRRHHHGQAEAAIIATTIVALWRTAWRDGVGRVGRGESVGRARAWQHELLTRGFDAIDAAFGDEPVAPRRAKPR